MGAGKAVNANVLLFDPVTGERTFVEAGQVPDEKIADQLGDHLFGEAAGVAADGDEPESDGVPPRSGKGSGKEAWVAYAEANGVEVTAEMNRDDVIAAVEAAGVAAE